MMARPRNLTRPVAPPGQPPAADRAGGSSLARVGWWLLALLAVLALVLSAVQAQKMTVTQQQVARLTDEAIKRSVAAKTASEQATAELRQASEKLAALDARVRDLTAYREQMRDLVQTVVQARDESLLANLDASLLLSQDQAQLTDSPQPMVVALRAANRRIAQSSDPRLTPVRHAIERDLQRLKEVQVPDTAGLLARLDDVLHQVDELPMAGATDTAAEGEASRPQETAPVPGGIPWWVRTRRWLADAICGPWCTRDVVLGLPAPKQDEVFFLREGLRLRLMSAKLSLLSRRNASARDDLAAAVTQLKLAFDTQAEEVIEAIASLQQVRELAHVPVLPNLADTLTALDGAAAQPEKDE